MKTRLIARMSIIALLTCAALVPGRPAGADTASETRKATEEARKKGKAAVKEFEAGKMLHNEGRFEAGLAKMARGLAVMQSFEDGYAKSTQKLTEKETKAALFMGGMTAFRLELARVYTSHGCFARAAPLVERDVRLFKRFHGYENMKEYRPVIGLHAYVLRELGPREKAIAATQELLDYFRRVRQSSVPSAMAILARLYREAGDAERAAQLIAEARKLYERRWQTAPRGEPTRSFRRARLQRIAGRYGEAEKTLRQVLDAEFRKPKPRHAVIARLYRKLAFIYDRGGDAAKQVDALSNAIRYRQLWRSARKHLPKQKKSTLVRVHYQLAKAYKKAGRRAEAKKLADEYRLCLN